MRFFIKSVSLAALAAACHATPAWAADAETRCQSMTALKLVDTNIISAQFVPARAAASQPWTTPNDHPAFCRVVARVQSEPGSDIGVEIWLPAENWAGVFHGNGNGGFGGILAGGYASMADGLRRGFASATTDTGTAPATPLEGDALVGQPRKWKDWGRLSTHVMTKTGKALTKAYYGKNARTSYYTGCSTGGQQGLIEALYYPDDYDGILVGAPVINRTWGHAAVLWNYSVSHQSEGHRLSKAKLKLLNRAATASCYRQGHGFAGDAFVSDPMACKFDPAVLQCTGTVDDQCLTPTEIETARAFYSGPTTQSGQPSYFGWLPGSEMAGLYDWSFLQSPINGQPPFAGLFKWVFGPDWDWRGFDFGRDMPIVNAALDADVNDATRGDLSAYAKRGGKIILYHGLADTLTAPAQTVGFFDRQSGALGGQSQINQTARLFLAPGVMHCGGGTGPDSFNGTLGIPPRPPSDDARHDMFSALIAWTEQDIAPDMVVATKYAADDSGEIVMQRPLCPYPKKITYRGFGSTRAASSFRCE